MKLEAASLSIQSTKKTTKTNNGIVQFVHLYLGCQMSGKRRPCPFLFLTSSIRQANLNTWTISQNYCVCLLYWQMYCANRCCLVAILRTLQVHVAPTSPRAVSYLFSNATVFCPDVSSPRFVYCYSNVQYNTIQFRLLKTIRIKTGRSQLTQPQLRPITWWGLIKFRIKWIRENINELKYVRKRGRPHTKKSLWSLKNIQRFISTWSNNINKGTATAIHTSCSVLQSSDIGFSRPTIYLG